MTAPRSWATPLEARTRKAAVAAAICVFAWMALLPIHDGAAQEPRDPSAEQSAPPSPTADSGGHAKAAPSPTAGSGRDRRRLSAPSDEDDGGVPLVTLTLLALVTAGMMVTFAGIGRRRREGEREAAPAPLPAAPAKAARPQQPLWHGRSDRFGSAARTTVARPSATVAVTEQRDGEDPRGSAEDRSNRDTAAAPDADQPRSATPAAAAPTAASPPNAHLEWTAEIEWRQIHGTARFRVIARGPGTVTLAQSPPLEWPPSGPAAVQATTDAAEQLSAAMMAAGWKSRPPGRAWYAKRFAWEPVAATPAAGATAAPSNGAAAAKAPAAPGEAPAPARDDGPVAHWRSVAWLGVLAAVGILVVPQLDSVTGSGSGSKPPLYLSILLLGLAAVLLLVLIIRRIWRGPR
jgi:hypothetical protein